MKFEETYLNDNILDALYDMHFEEMTPIQERCISCRSSLNLMTAAIPKMPSTVSSCHPHENWPSR